MTALNVDLTTGKASRVPGGALGVGLGPEFYEDAIQSHLDAQARRMGYDNAAALMSWSGSGNPEWAGEAAAFAAWRDAVWSAAIQLMDGPVLSMADFHAGLPVFDEGEQHG